MSFIIKQIFINQSIFIMKTLFLVLFIFAFIVVSLEMILQYIISSKKETFFKESFSSLTSISVLALLILNIGLLFFDKTFYSSSAFSPMKIPFMFFIPFIIFLFGYSDLKFFSYLISYRNKVKKLKEFELNIDYGKTSDQLLDKGRYKFQDDTIDANNFSAPPEMIGKRVMVKAKFFYFDCDYDLVIDQIEKDGFRPATLMEILHFGIIHPRLIAELSMIAWGTSVLNSVRRYHSSFVVLRFIPYCSVMNIACTPEFYGHKYLLAIKKNSIKYLD